MMSESHEIKDVQPYMLVHTDTYTTSNDGIYTNRYTRLASTLYFYLAHISVYKLHRRSVSLSERVDFGR